MSGRMTPIVFASGRPSVDVTLASGERCTLPIEGGGRLKAGDWLAVEVEETRQVAIPAGQPARTSPAVEKLYQTMQEQNLSPAFPREVAEEVEAILEAPGIDAPDLEDLTDLPFVTIDHRDSRDLDQAVYVCHRKESSGFTVFYALADASYYVKPGTALFAEALKRGVSYYLPGFSVPMLPRSLCEGVISLNPNVERRALVVQIDLDQDGEAAGMGFVRARIRSRQKLAYTDVQQHLDAPDDGPFRNAPFAESLGLLREVGRRRIALSEARDVVEFRRQELEVELAKDDGYKLQTQERKRVAVEEWNAHVSLLTNMEGARFLKSGVPKKEVQPIFRVHPSPPRDRIGRLEKQIEALVDAKGLDPSIWRWHRQPKDGRNRESLADYLARLPWTGPHARLSKALHRQALYTNLGSSFTSLPGRHHGVGADQYARLSAPMREIVGIFTHKELFEHLGVSEPPEDASEDEALRTQVIDAANEANRRQRRIEKAAHKLLVDQILSEDLGHPVASRATYPATIIGIRRDRIYVELDDPPLELKLYGPDLEEETGESLAYDKGKNTLFLGENQALALRLGDELTLRVSAHHAPTGRWKFSLI